jgi:hypothetical protein
LKPYAKLSIARIHQGRPRDARRIVSNYRKKYGARKLLLLIGALSLLGRSSIGRAMRLHEDYQRWSVRNSFTVPT